MLLFKIGQYEAAKIMTGDDADLEDVAATLLGIADRDNLEWVLRVQLGIATEPLNVKFFKKLFVEPNNFAFWSPAHSAEPLHPHQVASLLRHAKPEQTDRYHRFVSPNIPDTVVKPDGFGWDTDGKFFVMDAKMTGRSFEDAVAHYYPHMQYTMMLMGARRAFLSIFLGMDAHRVATMEANSDYQAEMAARITEFHKRVLNGAYRLRQAIGAPRPPTKAEVDRALGRIDMTSRKEANQWASAAADFLTHLDAEKKLKDAKETIKALVPAGAALAFGNGIECAVAKNGAKTIRKV